MGYCNSICRIENPLSSTWIVPIFFFTGRVRWKSENMCGKIRLDQNLLAAAYAPYVCLLGSGISEKATKNFSFAFGSIFKITCLFRNDVQPLFFSHSTAHNRPNNSKLFEFSFFFSFRFHFLFVRLDKFVFVFFLCDLFVSGWISKNLDPAHKVW